MQWIGKLENFGGFLISRKDSWEYTESQCTYSDMIWYLIWRSLMLIFSLFLEDWCQFNYLLDIHEKPWEWHSRTEGTPSTQLWEQGKLRLDDCCRCMQWPSIWKVGWEIITREMWRTSLVSLQQSHRGGGGGRERVHPPVEPGGVQRPAGGGRAGGEDPPCGGLWQRLFPAVRRRL